MKGVIRVLKFVKNYYKSPRFFIAYCFHFLSPTFKQHIKFFTTEEFRKEILSGKSFIRIGDGEVGIINGTGPLFYQKHEQGLAKILKEMIVSYRQPSPYVLGLPQEFIEMSNRELRTRNRFFCFYPVKIAVSIWFPKDVPYGDAIMFYYGDKFIAPFWEYIGDKKVIFVSNQDTIDKWTGVKTPFASLVFIEGPKKDAFSNYDILIQRIEHEVVKSGDDKPVLLLSVGPASKALAYYFSKKGITSYDLGLGAEVLFQKKDYTNRI